VQTQSCFPFHTPATWTPKDDLRLLAAQERVAALEGVRLTDAAVFVALLWFAGPAGCFPAHASIADRAHVSLATVKRSLAKLRALGLVSWVRQSGTPGNRYTFHRPELFRPTPRPERSPQHPHSIPNSTPSAAPPKIAQSEPSKSLKVSDETEREDTEAALAGGEDDAAEVGEEIRHAVGFLGASDPLPRRLLRLAATMGGTKDQVIGWIRANAGKRLRSPGFFWAIRSELKEWVGEAQGAVTAEMRGECEDCGRPIDAYLSRCGDCEWIAAGQAPPDMMAAERIA